MSNTVASETMKTRLRALYLQRRNMHANVLRDSGMLADADATLHPKWDGGVDARGVHHKGCWQKLADYALASRIDPVVWVSSLFNLTYLFDHVPYPTDLMNKKVLELVGRYGRERALDVKFGARTELLLVSKEIMSRKLQTKLPEDVVVRQVLVDPSVEASPLTRYVHAVYRKVPDLAVLLEREAVFQYRTAPEPYREAFGSLLPKRLLELAAK